MSNCTVVFSTLIHCFHDRLKSSVYLIVGLLNVCGEKNVTIVNRFAYRMTVTKITVVFYTNQPVATAKIAK